MNRSAHAFAGALTSAGTYVIIKRSLGEEIDWVELSAIGLGGSFVGILPDILEPATSPHHRSFFHSVSFFAIGYLSYRYFVKKSLNNKQLEVAIKAIVASYGSHLLLDATTPMGLPWIVKGC